MPNAIKKCELEMEIIKEIRRHYTEDLMIPESVMQANPLFATATQNKISEAANPWLPGAIAQVERELEGVK